MAQAPFDFKPFEVLTFDCYGTLIDWEAGIVAGLRRVVGDAGPDDEQLLEAYGRAETAIEGGPWQPYRAVLGAAMETVCRPLGITPTFDQARTFAESVGDWPPFADSAAALARLGQRYELGLITNCDDDLVAVSNRRLGEPFRWIVTAEQARSYKPAARNFELALERIGRSRGRILHVAQSLFHDHVPARSLGLATAGIDRRHGRPGSGATPAATARPDLIAPDMATFAHIALAG